MPASGNVEAHTPPPAIDPTAAGKTILLVEDDRALRALAARVLRKYGYEVIDASSGTEALAVGERCGPSIDLLVSDMVMPGMNGNELADAVAVRWPHVKILLMSGYTTDVIARTGLATRANALLEKPFTPDRLAAAVRDVLDASNDTRPEP